jgi:5-methylcytosine-specific restriction protein A
MATFLFAWNPKKWKWKEGELTKQVLKVAATGSAEDLWSCGNRKDLPVGSRFFLIRLGQEPRGIVGSGQTTSHPELGPHWDATLRRLGKEALSVDIKFDFLSKQPLITWNELQKSPYSSVSWGIQASGVLLPESITKSLEELWARRTHGTDPILPEEVALTEDYAEGAQKRVSVNAYERNPQARAACIAHFGLRCSVCRLLLEDRYGSIAAGFVQVHHIVPLSEVRPGYRVNPRKDLRPVCPNCHAVIHRRQPPLSIAQARRLVRKDE